MIGSEHPKLKTAFYESHFRHCELWQQNEVEKANQFWLFVNHYKVENVNGGGYTMTEMTLIKGSF